MDQRADRTETEANRPTLFLGCLAAALTVHGAVLAVTLWSGLALPGSGGREPEAIALDGAIAVATEADPGALSEAAGEITAAPVEPVAAAEAKPEALRAIEPPAAEAEPARELAAPSAEADTLVDMAPDRTAASASATLAAADPSEVLPTIITEAPSTPAPPAVTARALPEPQAPVAPARQPMRERTDANPAPRKAEKPAEPQSPRAATKTGPPTRTKTAARTDAETEQAGRSEAGRDRTASDGGSGRKGAAAASAGAAANPGAARKYGAVVRARIAQNRARQGAGTGRAVISFAISPSGSLRYARIGRSSGTAALDSAALASVQRAAPFPTPPAGMSGAQLSFAIPFDFR